MKPKLYAFWRYDVFPFVSGGTVTEQEGDSVQTEEYGTGYWFKACYITGLREGRFIQKKLNELTMEHAKQLISIENVFLKKVKDEFPAAFSF